ncbi:Response regulator of the competence regulon ComE [Streptococcus mitis]|uniref:Response regulator of the competence regulon ComE n=1 Tax=Streptococcus mitis TaxID=28037 RepID=A0A150NJV5_STRMT|nr:Response regulator of the competence regulon ComE [Streptococcus mitis]
MKVLILEDVIEHQVRLERILDEISKESNIPISYKTTGKVREFKEYIENDEVNQLYFLDIDIHGIEKKRVLKLPSLFVITILMLLSSLSPVDQSLRL